MADRIDEQPAVAPVATPAPAVVPASPSLTPTPEPAVTAQADQPTAVDPAASPGAPSTTPGAADPLTKADDGLGPTLLQEFDAAKEKPVEAKPIDPAAPKPAEAKPAETPPIQAAPTELPQIDYWKDVAVPETIKIADAQRGEVNSALDLIRGGKAPEGVGKLVGLHEQAMKDYAAEVAKQQWDTFRETNKAWRSEVMADPYLGGSGHQTAMAAVARMRDMAVSSHRPGTPEYEADRKTFDNFLVSTGAGNHPAFLRLMHNFARYFDEPAMPPADIKPAKDNGRAPGDRRGRMYPSMQKGT
jgi:hypothetical protein